MERIPAWKILFFLYPVRFLFRLTKFPSRRSLTLRYEIESLPFVITIKTFLPQKKSNNSLQHCRSLPATARLLQDHSEPFQ